MFRNTVNRNYLICEIFLKSFISIVTYCTKCWKINLSMLKFAGGNLFRSPRKANNRQLRSAFTSIFIGFAELRPPLEPAISSNSFIISCSNNGGKCFEKKSFKAVATALTGISNFSISTLSSSSNFWYSSSTCARFPGTRYMPEN